MFGRALGYMRLLALLGVGLLAGCSLGDSGGFEGTESSLPHENAVLVLPLTAGTYQVSTDTKTVVVPQPANQRYVGVETPLGKVTIGFYDLDGPTKAEVAAAKKVAKEAKAKGETVAEVPEVSLVGRHLVAFVRSGGSYSYYLAQLEDTDELVVYDTSRAAGALLAKVLGEDTARSKLVFNDKELNQKFLRQLSHEGDRDLFKVLFRLRRVSS